MHSVLFGVLYVLMLAIVINVGRRTVGGRDLKPRSLTYILVSLVAILSFAQFALPQLYDWLSRQPQLIIEGHQYWRLISSVLVQDGGIAGTLFNLIALILVTLISYYIWGTSKSIIIFFISAIVFNIIAILSNMPGAGNSGATFALATSVVGAVCVRQPMDRLIVWCAIAILSIGTVLILLGDIHGYAIIFGTIIGILFYKKK